MDLLIPDYGLLFWQLIVFSIVLTILAVFVWKPVTEALRTRESMIEDSLESLHGSIQWAIRLHPGCRLRSCNGWSRIPWIFSGSYTICQLSRPADGILGGKTLFVIGNQFLD